MTILDTIVDAINNRKAVVLNYQGHRRWICPHAVGSKNGTLRVLGYQFGGTSGSSLGSWGSGGNWRCMLLDGITGVSAVNTQWHTGNRHTQPQTCISEVIAEVR